LFALIVVLFAGRADGTTFTDSDCFDSSSAGTSISSTANHPWRFAAADVDGDGRIDLVAPHQYAKSVLWYQNSGTSTFTQKTVNVGTETKASGPGGVFVADMNGDTYMDILVTYADGGAIAWYKNDGSETFTRQDIDNYISSPVDSVVVDI
jgi:hypothetical protein